jgi:hypothetical protein
MREEKGSSQPRGEKCPPPLRNSKLSLQDLTVLPTEIFRQRKTHIPSVINLLTESPTEMLRR